MASIGKRVSGAWQNTSYGIRATATDTITTLPTTIYGDGTNATINLKGNTVQNGTPTPSAPIIQQGCGELDSGQYKIPILSAGLTSTVNLGEVLSIRKIKKWVLAGTENWQMHQTYSSLFRLDITGYLFSETNTSLCTHYKSIINTGAAYVDNGETCFYYGGSTARLIYIKDETYTSAADFKAFLATQYANGTPVTVWYILDEAETATVNESLMKIDGYADELNGISIPTTDGANSLSVGTTVQPSEVSVNYHGWHMGTVHERVSDEWD